MKNSSISWTHWPKLIKNYILVWSPTIILKSTSNRSINGYKPVPADISNTLPLFNFYIPIPLPKSPEMWNIYWDLVNNSLVNVFPGYFLISNGRDTLSLKI